MKIQTLQIKDLTPDPQNARQHDEKNLKAIQGSLKEFGQRKPIVITEAGVIVAGNGTVEAAKRLGWLEIQAVTVPGDWTPEQTKAFALADNRTAELAAWSPEVLASQLVELEAAGFEIEEFGFEKIEVAEEPREIVEDEVPESAPQRSSLGDVWQLGRHRLMVGDATNEEDVNKVMAGKKANMIFTDPPYNVAFSGQRLSNTTKNGEVIKNHKGANTKHEDIGNDNLAEEEFYSFISKALKNLWTLEPSSWYFTFGAQTLDQLLLPLKETGFNWKSIIIWKKNQATLSGMDYKSRYEPIVYGCKPNSFYGERYLQEDIWEFQRTLKNDLHPTMKPIPLIAYAIENSSKQGQIVVDFFCGSGSTLIACEQTDRTCYGMELDPKYCDVIITRWETLTGQKAELLDSKTP
jgi:site-specific DNA-methyltransferase (adenine-specific)